MARSSSGGVTVHCVLPISWTTPCLHITEIGDVYSTWGVLLSGGVGDASERVRSRLCYSLPGRQTGTEQTTAGTTRYSALPVRRSAAGTPLTVPQETL